jgi:5-methylcytosine-specific restriction protein A
MIAKQKNPPWHREELILALELYYRVDASRLRPEDPEVVELSSLLNRLPFY